MEIRSRLLLVSAALAALVGCASFRPEEPPPREEPSQFGDEPAPPPRVIEPEVERRDVKVPKIEASNIEFGAYYGALSIEDFGTNPLYGLRADFHVTEDFFVEARWGRSTAGRTSFETLGGNIQLLTDSERRFTHYDFSLGYNLLPGEVYLGRGTALNSALYLLGGVGSTKFAGDQHFTLNFGAGYRVLPTDWLAIHVDFQNHVFQSDLLGRNKLTSNLGAFIGATVFF